MRLWIRTKYYLQIFWVSCNLLICERRYLGWRRIRSVLKTISWSDWTKSHFFYFYFNLIKVTSTSTAANNKSCYFLFWNAAVMVNQNYYVATIYLPSKYKDNFQNRYWDEITFLWWLKMSCSSLNLKAKLRQLIASIQNWNCGIPGAWAMSISRFRPTFRPSSSSGLPSRISLSPWPSRICRRPSMKRTHRMTVSTIGKVWSLFP